MKIVITVHRNKGIANMLIRFFHIFSVSLLSSGIFLCVACASDEGSLIGPNSNLGPGEEELITTIVITLTTLTGDATTSASFQDLDGEGGNDPIVQNLIVAKSTVYNGSVEVLDETKTPPEDITQEVKEEAEEHQFFYEFGGGISNSVLTYRDYESVYGENSGSDLPVGIEFRLEIPQEATDGNFRVTLNHYDEMPKDGLNPSTETDIDVIFDVIVE